MANECSCAVTGVGGAVFVLCEHEPVSQEKKMTTGMDGRNKEKKNKKGKRRQSA